MNQQVNIEMEEYGDLNYSTEEINDLLGNTLLKREQSLTPEEQDQVKSNLGIFSDETEFTYDVSFVFTTSYGRISDLLFRTIATAIKEGKTLKALKDFCYYTVTGYIDTEGKIILAYTDKMISEDMDGQHYERRVMYTLNVPDGSICRIDGPEILTLPSQDWLAWDTQLGTYIPRPEYEALQQTDNICNAFAKLEAGVKRFGGMQELDSLTNPTFEKAACFYAMLAEAETLSLNSDCGLQEGDSVNIIIWALASSSDVTVTIPDDSQCAAMNGTTFKIHRYGEINILRVHDKYYIRTGTKEL